ncbi:MAG: hypothetical protein IPM18_11165 [Phycisphaerales bacterium]|nr:hypothetical protein [Phycisphaerales bacterium]
MARRAAELIHSYAHSAPEERLRLLEERLAHFPRCALTRYLAGCSGFDHGRPATAVRHMMIAHHADPHLESAALLAFAGLNWTSQPGSPLLRVVLETWEEFRRPLFDRYPLERRLLDAFADQGSTRDDLPALARRLWRLPLATLRAQLRAALDTRDVEMFPLLAATV